MKKLTVKQFATVKRVAMNVNPLVTKKNKLVERINEMVQEVEALEHEIAGHEGGVVSLTGYQSEALVHKVIEVTDKRDKQGNPIKVTKYLPSNLLEFSEADNCYYIKEFDAVCPEPIEVLPAEPSVETELPFDNL